MKRTLRTTLMLLTLLPISLSAQDSDFRMNQEFADHFAREWIEAWNAHDLERILSHYNDEFRMSSPRIIDLGFSDTGTLQGKEAMREYWGPSLVEGSNVRFELINTYVGANSVTIHYRSISNDRLATEVFIFDEHGEVIEAFAHYLPPRP